MEQPKVVLIIDDQNDNKSAITSRMDTSNVSLTKCIEFWRHNLSVKQGIMFQEYRVRDVKTLLEELLSILGGDPQNKTTQTYVPCTAIVLARSIQSCPSTLPIRALKVLNVRLHIVTTQLGTTAMKQQYEILTSHLHGHLCINNTLLGASHILQDAIQGHYNNQRMKDVKLIMGHLSELITLRPQLHWCHKYKTENIECNLISWPSLSSLILAGFLPREQCPTSALARTFVYGEEKLTELQQALLTTNTIALVHLSFNTFTKTMSTACLVPHANVLELIMLDPIAKD